MREKAPNPIEQVRREFDSLVAAFESKFSLAALHSITDITMEESRRHPLREPARVALFKIVEKLNKLKVAYGETSAEYKHVKEKYMRLSRAVGMINNNKVDHNR